MLIDSQKFREALENKDELNIYSEFYNILESVVSLSKNHKELSTNEEISTSVNILIEIYNIAMNLYLKMKDMKKEEILQEIEKIEDLGCKAEDILCVEENSDTEN